MGSSSHYMTQPKQARASAGPPADGKKSAAKDPKQSKQLASAAACFTLLRCLNWSPLQTAGWQHIVICSHNAVRQQHAKQCIPFYCALTKGTPGAGIACVA